MASSLVARLRTSSPPSRLVPSPSVRFRATLDKAASTFSQARDTGLTRTNLSTAAGMTTQAQGGGRVGPPRVCGELVLTRDVVGMPGARCTDGWVAAPQGRAMRRRRSLPSDRPSAKWKRDERHGVHGQTLSNMPLTAHPYQTQASDNPDARTLTESLRPWTASPRNSYRCAPQRP